VCDTVTQTPTRAEIIENLNKNGERKRKRVRKINVQNDHVQGFDFNKTFEPAETLK
jgi:hypothetical protein